MKKTLQKSYKPSTKHFQGVEIHKLKRISVKGGDVQHYLKNTDPGFLGFGEVYFSRVDYKEVKAWKRHRDMTLNLAVPVGEVKFVFLNNFDNTFKQILIGESAYVRLTVSPGVWFGFQGLTKSTSLVASLINKPHDPEEIDRKERDSIGFKW